MWRVVHNEDPPIRVRTSDIRGGSWHSHSKKSEAWLGSWSHTISAQIKLAEWSAASFWWIAFFKRSFEKLDAVKWCPMISDQFPNKLFIMNSSRLSAFFVVFSSGPMSSWPMMSSVIRLYSKLLFNRIPSKINIRILCFSSVFWRQSCNRSIVSWHTPVCMEKENLNNVCWIMIKDGYGIL